MSLARFRRRVAKQCLWWCLAGILLSALQPFLFNHFRSDGWEDEPGFRIRDLETVAVFSPDDRELNHEKIETTLYVPNGASIDSSQLLQQGLDLLKVMVGVMLPLAFLLLRQTLPPKPNVPRPSRYRGGAPPPTAMWRTQPPPTAPPSLT